MKFFFIIFFAAVTAADVNLMWVKINIWKSVGKFTILSKSHYVLQTDTGQWTG